MRCVTRLQNRGQRGYVIQAIAGSSVKVLAGKRDSPDTMGGSAGISSTDSDTKVKDRDVFRDAPTSVRHRLPEQFTMDGLPSHHALQHATERLGIAPKTVGGHDRVFTTAKYPVKPSEVYVRASSDWRCAIAT